MGVKEDGGVVPTVVVVVVAVVVKVIMVSVVEAERMEYGKKSIITVFLMYFARRKTSIHRLGLHRFGLLSEVTELGFISLK